MCEYKGKTGRTQDMQFWTKELDRFARKFWSVKMKAENKKQAELDERA